jgi:hypothetical protein
VSMAKPPLGTRIFISSIAENTTLVRGDTTCSIDGSISSLSTVVFLIPALDMENSMIGHSCNSPRRKLPGHFMAACSGDLGHQLKDTMYCVALPNSRALLRHMRKKENQWPQETRTSLCGVFSLTIRFWPMPKWNSSSWGFVTESMMIEFT